MRVALRSHAVWALSALVTLAIAGSLLLLGNAVKRQRNTDAILRQDFETVMTLRRTQGLLVDAETGQRGFLVTSNPSFLEPYNRARAQLPAELRRLEGQMGPNKLRSLSEAKLNELSETVQLARAGQKVAAIAIVQSGRGKALMDDFRAEAGRQIDSYRIKIDSAISQSERFTKRTYTALLGLIFSAMLLLWLALSNLVRTRQLEAEAVRLREVAEAERRTSLVARELNHRVKNLFSIVLAIVQLASRGSSTPREAVSRISERIHALARAHEVSLGTDPTAGFDLRKMLQTILSPYASSSSALELVGTPVTLPAMRVTPIGLIVHELATNAMKHGAWSFDGGKITIEWTVADTPLDDSFRLLQLRWVEDRGEPISSESGAGFGSKLIQAAVAQLGGSMIRERRENGLTVTIDAPIVPTSAH